jgi:hypothetical protein
MGIMSTHKQLIKVTQSQLPTQGQSFKAKLASLEVIVKQVLNCDQAMRKFERVPKKGVSLW